MSYNGYNQYSPYWQQGAGSYQPLSAYQSSQQATPTSVSQSAENSSGTSYGSQGYGNVAVSGAGSGRSQDFRSSYTNTNDRASLDGATALGNLAYASSLGRDGSSQQITNYSQQQSSSNYGTASPYRTTPAPLMQNWTGNERRESSKTSREDTNARAQQATASPSFAYSSKKTPYQGPSAGSSAQAQTQYQSSHSTSEQHKTNQYSQPSRPTSGQAIQQPQSRPDSRAAPAPATHIAHSITNQSQARNDSGNGRGTQTRVQTPQQSTNRPSSSNTPGPSERPQARKGALETAKMNAANSAKKSKGAAHLATEEMTVKRNGDAPQSPIVEFNRQASKPATPVEPQYTTVDPSQVFNHAEYSRRQAAAAAEIEATKKAAKEVEAAKLAATQPKPPLVNRTSATASAPASEPDLAKKDQMELEMKQMIEKMRDYKAKDPSLFTEIWEQVKKSQPPQRAPSQPLQGSATSPIVINGQLPSPSLIQSQLPSESDLLANGDFPPNFDRGRFPAQRRRRGGGTKAPSSRKSGISNSSTQPVAQTQITDDQGTPLPPEIAIPTPKVGEIFPDPGSQSMQEAMQQFHQNSKSPVPKAQQTPSSNKQAAMSITTLPQKASPPIVPPSQSAPPPKQGGTYWPESKKEALAEAARNSLISTTPNQGKSITTQEIHELLDTNPSYTQMCQILEYRGFIIDRGQFARILLKAVPDLGSASNPASATPTSSASTNPVAPTHATSTVTASNNGTTKANSKTPTAGSFGKLVKAPSSDSAPQTKIPQPLPYSAPPAPSLQAPNAYITPYAPFPPSTRQVSEGDQSSGVPREYRFVDPAHWIPGKPHQASGKIPGQPELLNPPYPVYQQSGPSDSQVIDQSGTIHPNGIISHPTKQEMARKRTFGEIVDLTTLLDEEELERRRPSPRTDYENASIPSNSAPNVFDQAAWRQQHSGRSTPKPFKYKYSGRDALLQSYEIVEPMNKRRDALRRSTYDPKTIARDFLLAIGKHPTMAPLNAHLDVLKDRFKAVDNDSDLSTFRWDLVDPEVVANMRSIDTDDEEVVPTMHAESRHRPAPMAVMVNVNGGGLAKEDQTLSHKRGSYEKTVRSGVQPAGSGGTPTGQAPQNLTPAQAFNQALDTKSTDLSRFAYSSPHATMQMNFTTPSTSNASTPGTALRRRGRPPGAKNKQVRSDKGIPKKPITPSIGATPSAAQARPSTEGSLDETRSVEDSSIGKPSTPMPTRPRINTTTPSRPSGLRNSMSAMTPTDGIAVVISSRSPSVVVTPQASARKGRPKSAEDRSNSTPSTPAYVVYRCHWENCPAELHNFETLKKHVKKHRRAVDDVYPCLWADCSDSSNPISNNTQNEEGQHKRLKFKTDDEWLTHMESNHLRAERELSAGTPGNGSMKPESDLNGGDMS